MTARPAPFDLRSSEGGAVTVDWVVLTAALVGLGVVVATTVADGSLLQAKRMERCMSGVGAMVKEDKPILDHQGSRPFWMGRHCEIRAERTN
ncbi:MAG: hypothetical protein ACU0CO_07175 [Shimia sp.]